MPVPVLALDLALASASALDLAQVLLDLRLPPQVAAPAVVSLVRASQHRHRQGHRSLDKASLLFRLLIQAAGCSVEQSHWARLCRL